MKIKGEKLQDPNEEILVLPRSNGNIVFKAKAILNFDDFDKICPPPKPSVKMLKGGIKVEDVESPIYKAKLNEYSRKRMSYMVLKSLEATEGLEWEKVSLSDPNTWNSYIDELRESGFSDVEMGRIVKLVMSVNSLDEERLEQARKDFLAGQQAQVNQSLSLQEELISTQSGEPVNA